MLKLGEPVGVAMITVVVLSLAGCAPPANNGVADAQFIALHGSDPKALDDRFGADSEVACSSGSDDYLRSIAAHEFKWSDDAKGFTGTKFAKFSTLSAGVGLLTDVSDRALLSNGFGAFDPVTFYCLYDAGAKKVVRYSADDPGLGIARTAADRNPNVSAATVNDNSAPSAPASAPISFDKPAVPTSIENTYDPGSGIARTAADTNPNVSAATVNDNSALSAPASAPISFDKPAVPTSIENTYCQMGECLWEQIVTVTDLTMHGNDVLRKVVIRQTGTETPESQNYPNKLPLGKHDWKTRTSYFLCSLSRPAAIDWDSDTKDWMVTQLTVVSPFGYMRGTTTNYKRACHGIKPGSNLDQHPDQLGYVDRDDVSQPHVKQLADVIN